MPVAEAKHFKLGRALALRHERHTRKNQSSVIEGFCISKAIALDKQEVPRRKNFPGKFMSDPKIKSWRSVMFCHRQIINQLESKHVDYHMKRFGFAQSNVEFHLGCIEDPAELGIADNSIDVVVSNCAINPP